MSHNYYSTYLLKNQYKISIKPRENYNPFHALILPYDNSVVESFFSSLKREELYRTKYRSDNEFKKAVDDYMVFYNAERPHSNNNYRTPDAKEAEYFSKDDI